MITYTASCSATEFVASNRNQGFEFWHFIITKHRCVRIYSGTSHNGLSDIWTASLQRTNNVPPIDFAVEIIHFQPPSDGQPPISGQQTENVPLKDK